jgi:acyl-CoA synthetase (AMP-forming)/AMP-acid ligase II
MNPAEFLTISSAVLPDREALVSGDGATRVTYEAMGSRVNRLSNALQARGVGPGSRIAVMSTNSSEFVEVYYACAKLGACFVPVNYRAKREELAYMLDASDVSIVFVGERYRPLLDSVRPELKKLQDVFALESGGSGLTTLDELIASAADEELFIDIDEDEPSVLIFTSGTTALPKGVELTYLNLSLYGMNTMSPADPEAEHEKTLLSVPIAHVAGITAILSSIWGGRTLVVLPQFEPGQWLEAVQRERVTHAFVVPTMLKRLMDHPSFENYDLSSLQLITYGAAPMPYEVVCRAIEVFDCGLMNAYGQTESTSSLTYLGPEDHRLDGSPEENAKKLHRLRSVGRPMDDVELAIIAGRGEPQPCGAEGEICIRSARVMKEYLKQAAATAEAVHDGWLHTGDLGFLDEDNYLFITGRVKDLIIRGGENISTGEIEAILDSHPDVAESAVIGVPDPEWGEAVKAIVVLKSGASDPALPDGLKGQAAGGSSPVRPELLEGRTPKSLDELRADLQAYCKARLSSYKTPAYVAFVDELPRNPMGKVLKTDLRRDHGGADNN